jgi:hypothetical protein
MRIIIGAYNRMVMEGSAAWLIDSLSISAIGSLYDALSP